MSIVYRLYEPRDLYQTATLINRIHQDVNPEIPQEAWARMEAGDHATVIAEEHGRIVGAIPFDVRDLTLRPGVTIRGAFAHCVGVDETLRGLGVGSGMMACARREFGRFCDGLFVYTGGEGDQPYTFYEHNGFVDLHYTRTYTLPNPQGGWPQGVSVFSLNPMAPPGEELNGPFQAAYAGRGGFPPRSPGYWRRALDSIIYIQMPRAYYLARVEEGGELAGYALWGERSHGWLEQGAVILELAVRPGAVGVAKRLLQAVVAGAAARGASQVSMTTSQHHPALPDLLGLGFQPGTRAEGEILAGQLLHLESVWRKLAGDDAPALRVWTPEEESTCPGAGTAVTLEMKRPTLQRLFMCRLNLEEALADERVTTPAWPLPLEALHQAFRPALWIHHEIDWI